MNNYMKTIISGLKQWVSAQITKSKSDWNQNDPNEINYVKNRTHYSYEKEIVFLPNTNLTENDVDGIGVATINLPSAIKVGQEYKVIFDGSEYSCVGYTNTNVPGFIMLGNMNIVESMIGVDFADTGEPFVVVYTSTRASVANAYIYTPTVDSHTIKITYMGEAVKKIDKKYLPSMDYVSYNAEQNLTGDQMALARWNIGAGTSDFDGNYNSLTNKPTIKQDVVQYNVTQSLSDTNKSRARSNIGAVSENDVTALIGDAIDPINQDILDLNGLVGSEKVSTQISNAIDEAMADVGGVGESTGTNGAEIFNDYDNNIATGAFSHAEGTYTKAVGAYSHTEGQFTEANGMNSHAEGYDTVAEGNYSHTEGIKTTAYGEGAHAEGYSFSISPNITETSTNDEIAAAWSAASTQFTLAKGQGSHAEGSGNLALKANAHAEGKRTVAIGADSHAEGYQTIARGDDSHIEGISDSVLPSTITSESTNDDILAQWKSTKFSMAAGYGSHVEGRSNLALNTAAHAEGYHTVAKGSRSHSEGEGTRAMSNNQHVQGKYNTEDANSVYAHIVGNGSNESSRSNAHTVDWDGNAWFAGDIKIGGTGQYDEEAKTLATTTYTDNAVAQKSQVQIITWEADD